MEYRPRIRTFLFVLSLLFTTLPADIISKQSRVEIDFAEKRVEFHFLDLGIPESDTGLAHEALATLDTATSVMEQRGKTRLDTFYLYSTNNQLNAKLSFNYSNKKDIYELLLMKKRDSLLHYEILQLEQMVNTDGEVTKEGESTYVSWRKSRSTISIQTSHLKFEKKPAYNNTHSLLPAWNKMNQ